MIERKTLEYLVCPDCREQFDLDIGTIKDEEIVGGALICPRCKRAYSIRDSIPCILPDNLMNNGG